MKFKDIGAGPIVFLVHGFPLNGEIWNRQVDFLSSRYRLIIPDLPGNGISPIIPDMSMEGIAEALKELFDKIKNTADDKLVMIGHSMGGYMTLAFAEKYPQILKGIGLFQSTAFADTEEKKETRRKAIEFINTQGADEFIKPLIPNFFSPATKSKNPHLIEEQIDRGRGYPAEALIAYYQSMINRPDRTEVLKNAGFPVLFVLGEHDTAVPISDGLQQCYLPEKSYIHIFKNSGHMGMLEEPDMANRILEEFLQQT